eukprot:546268_1
MSLVVVIVQFICVILPLFQCKKTKYGGWKEVQDVTQIQDYVTEINEEIRILLNKNGYNINRGCYARVLSAESQVVAGMNYKVSIEICKEIEDIQFFVPLPRKGSPQTLRPRGLKLASTKEQRRRYKPPDIPKPDL